jgi:hypothetical protein
VAEALRFDGDARTVADEAIGPLFYGDCSAQDVALARGLLRPMPTAPPPIEPYRPAWRDITSTYVVCNQDRAIDPAAQRVMAQRATEVHAWDTSHSPFFSRPDLVVDLLSVLARR